MYVLFNDILYVCKMSMEFPSTFLLSVEDIDDILLLLTKRRCEMSMDRHLLLSVNPNRICKVFGQISRGINLQKRNSFHSNALHLVKVWSFGDLLTIP